MLEIYYVEDDMDTAAAVADALSERGFKVAVFATVNSVQEALKQHRPTLLVADWNLPDGRGVDLCKMVRAQDPELPVILLTVRDNSQDMIRGFECGADDYITKPFDMDVLYLRIRALLRRTNEPDNRHIRCAEITIDRDVPAMAYVAQQPVELTEREYQLLLTLMENIGKTITRDQLLARIWDSTGSYVNDNTLTVTMKRLRQKLGNPTCLKTVRSFGYRMEDWNEKE